MIITEDIYYDIALDISTQPKSVPKAIADEFCTIYKIANNYEIFCLLPDPEQEGNVYICHNIYICKYLYNKFTTKYLLQLQKANKYHAVSMEALNTILPSENYDNDSAEYEQILSNFIETYQETTYKVGER